MILSQICFNEVILSVGRLINEYAIYYHILSYQIMSGKSPCLGLDRSVPSPSEEEGLRMEEREKEQVRIMMERRDDDRRRRGDGNGRKRR